MEDNVMEHPHPAADARMEVVKLSEIAPERLRWLWPQYLPLRKLVTLDGDPGQGKSTLALDIAARLSRGLPMPDGAETGLLADTLFLTYEDDAADTIRPRLEAAGGDATRVHHVKGVTRLGDNEPMPASLPSDIDALDVALKEHPDVRLVVVDPFAAALSSNVNSNRDQDVRRVTGRLANLAAKRDVCLVIVRHIRKDPGGNALAAGGGSMGGIIGVARSGLLVAKHPDEPNAAVLAAVKNNLAVLGASQAFRKVSATIEIAESGPIETSRLEWFGVSEHTANELTKMNSQGGGHAEARDAANWLRQLLADGARIDRKAVMTAGSAVGFRERSLERAANRLGVSKFREGYGTENRAFWSLARPPMTVTTVMTVMPDTVTGMTEASRPSPTPPTERAPERRHLSRRCPLPLGARGVSIDGRDFRSALADSPTAVGETPSPAEAPVLRQPSVPRRALV
jgi:hypothetical protein